MVIKYLNFEGSIFPISNTSPFAVRNKFFLASSIPNDKAMLPPLGLSYVAAYVSWEFDACSGVIALADFNVVNNGSVDITR